MEDNGAGAVTCRRARPGEEDAVRRVVLAAFGPGEQVVADLVEALRTSPAGVDDLSFVAELDGELVGYVLFTRSLLDAPRRLVDVLVLSPLGVVPEHQGRGIGSALVRHALATLGAAARAVGVSRGIAFVLLTTRFQPGRRPGVPQAVPARSPTRRSRCGRRRRTSRG